MKIKYLPITSPYTGLCSSQGLTCTGSPNTNSCEGSSSEFDLICTYNTGNCLYEQGFLSCTNNTGLCLYGASLITPTPPQG